MDTTGYGSASLKSSGFIGGAQVGYNYVFEGGPIVGVEADFSGSTIGDNCSAAVDGTTLASGGSGISYLGTVRGRVGCAFGPVMGYLTGGFAYAGVRSTLSVAGYGSASVNNMHEGYVAGAGLEYALAENVTLRTEYLRVMLDARRLTDVPYNGGLFTITERPDANIVRAAVNLRFPADGFWSGPPVVARY